MGFGAKPLKFSKTILNIGEFLLNQLKNNVIVLISQNLMGHNRWGARAPRPQL